MAVTVTTMVARRSLHVPSSDGCHSDNSGHQIKASPLY